MLNYLFMLCRNFKTNITKFAREALIPPGMLVIMTFGYNHYLYTQGIETGTTVDLMNGTMLFFSCLLIVTYTQTRIEDQSDYTLIFQDSGLSLIEKYRDEEEKVVGHIKFSDMKGIVEPKDYNYSWFMSWVFFTLKFVGKSHWLLYRQLRLQVKKDIIWPSDMMYSRWIIIPFYFTETKQISELAKTYSGIN